METTASEFVVALDIGSCRTRCLIAEVVDGSVHIVGRGDEPSRGVRRGEVFGQFIVWYVTVAGDDILQSPFLDDFFDLCQV